MNLRRVGWIIAVSITLHAQAQVDGIPKDLIEQRIEAAVEQLGGDENVDLTNLFEVLSDRYNDPIDLNHGRGVERVAPTERPAGEHDAPTCEA